MMFVWTLNDVIFALLAGLFLAFLVGCAVLLALESAWKRWRQ